jgi:hypothetical protein
MQQENGRHDGAKAPTAKLREHVYSGGGVEHQRAHHEIDGENPIKENLQIVLPLVVERAGLTNK